VRLATQEGLLVVAALRLEALALRRGSPHLRVERCGMGASRARRAATRLRAEPARALVVAGVGGALDARLDVGDVVVASELRTPDHGRLPLASDALYECLADLGLRVRVAPLVSTARPVRGARRGRLAGVGASGADCARAERARVADMESWWLAEAAGNRPFGVVRVVADGPEHELLRPGVVTRGMRALRVLSALAPGLQRWGAAVAPAAGAASSAERVFHANLQDLTL
jgi:4-hydroxy-3-methylbut-2-enyl diphosphate reductase